jgi:hypothetical protein
MKKQKTEHYYLLAILLTISIFCNSNVTPVGKASKQPAPLINDALIPPDIPPEHNSPITPGYYETSEYLIGSVAVGVIFLESDGTIDPQTENWTSSEESAVISEIQLGLNWWSVQNPAAGVSFTLELNYRVPTSYEPIRHPHTDEGLWISEAMNYLGYPGAFYFAQVRNYINDLRNDSNTNWAFAMFVVDSSNDSDGMFADPPPQHFAYAYLGGPFLVMTYDNDGWGIYQMDRVSAHEMGHIFYATDEYNGVTEYSGYLNVSDVEGSGDLMDTAAWSLSSGTQGQIGWNDTDSDGILDIVDTFPETTLNQYVPDPTNDATLVYTGSVTEVPYPNNNPYGTRRDVTINTITSVQFRIDYSAWVNANATDGVFDEAVEDFTFTTPSLSAGTHTIETRGVNSVGNVETSYSNDTVTIMDSDPPTTFHDYDGLWRTSDFTVNLTATDDLNDVAETHYKINNGPTKNVSTDGQPIITTESANNTLEYWSVDSADNEELPHKMLTGIKLDKTAPTGSIKIDITDVYTTSTSVTLILTATDEISGVFLIRFSNDGLWNTEPWENPSSTKVWTLRIGDGTKNVYYQITDSAGLVSETYSDSIILDTTSPAGSITINGGVSHTSTNTVTLDLSATDTTSGIAEVRFSNDNTTWTPWEAYTASKAWTLTNGDGIKTVYYQIRNNAGLVSAHLDWIVLDTNPPRILEIFPDNGTEIESSTITVTWIGLDETSDIDHYEIRLNNGSWINTGTDTTYTFTGTSDGSHFFDIRAIDKANNYKQVRIRFSANTSLIGGPGWIDDIAVFGILIFLIAGAIFLFIKKK